MQADTSRDRPSGDISTAVRPLEPWEIGASAFSLLLLLGPIVCILYLVLHPDDVFLGYYFWYCLYLPFVYVLAAAMALKVWRRKHILAILLVVSCLAPTVANRVGFPLLTPIQTSRK